jgi:hypothetical protein
MYIDTDIVLERFPVGFKARTDTWDPSSRPFDWAVLTCVPISAARRAGIRRDKGLTAG